MRSFQLKVKGPSQLVLAVFLFGLYLFVRHLTTELEVPIEHLFSIFFDCFSFFMFYMIYALFGTSFFIVFALWYIYTLQRCLLKQYHYLESKRQKNLNFEITITITDEETSL